MATHLCQHMTTPKTYHKLKLKPNQYGQEQEAKGQIKHKLK